MRLATKSAFWKACAPFFLLSAFILTGCQSGKVRIGNSKGRAWQWADAPKHVVEHASSVLGTTAQNWEVEHMVNFDEKPLSAAPFDVVVISAKHTRKNYICTIVNGEWTWLGGTNELNHLSALYQPVLQKLSSKKDESTTQAFCRDVAYLHKGPYRHLFTRDFEKDPYIEGWVYGTKSNVNDLHKYCIDPKIIVHGKRRELVFWVIVGDGAVERWAIRMRNQNGGTEITSIDVKEVEHRGTFNCPIAG